MGKRRETDRQKEREEEEEEQGKKKKVNVIVKNFRPSFSPEMLQAGAVNGLTSTETVGLIRDGGRMG